MKNPTAKAYQGPKNYKKLIQNVPKLHSLSNKQLKENKPFDKSLVMTYTIPSKVDIISKTDVGNNVNEVHHSLKSSTSSVSEAYVASYSPNNKLIRGKLESRQINEIVGRGLNIWRNSKTRLSNYSSKNRLKKEADSKSIDYWDVKRASKGFNLSWKVKKSSLLNKTQSSSLLGISNLSLVYSSKNHSELMKK